MTPRPKALAVFAAVVVLWLLPTRVTGGLTGRVIGVSDGGTIAVLLEGERQLRVRLSDIDTRERGEPYGTRARQSLSAVVFGKAMRPEFAEMDSYGRVVARAHADGRDVSAEMIRGGHAWVYPIVPWGACADRARAGGSRGKAGPLGSARGGGDSSTGRQVAKRSPASQRSSGISQRRSADHGRISVPAALARGERWGVRAVKPAPSEEGRVIATRRTKSEPWFGYLSYGGAVERNGE